MPVLDFQHLKQRLARAFPDDPVLDLADSADRLPPLPFVVGASESGVWRLRVMLDAHPALAVAPETGLLPAILARAAGAGPLSPLELRRLVTQLPRSPDLALDPDVLLAALTAHHPYSVPAGLRAFFSVYASGRGKPRAGDLIPGSVDRLRPIVELVPGARFVHVLLSNEPPVEATLPYLAIREEQLDGDPEPVMRQVCAFLDLPFDPCVVPDPEQARRLLD